MSVVHDTARALVAPAKGILAADESTGTIGKRFDSIGVASTEETRRRYRQLLFTTPGLGEHISGVILFDETIRQSADDGTPFVTVLEQARGDPRDQGRHRREAARGASTARPSPRVSTGLRERLAEYAELGARFAKWRATIIDRRRAADRRSRRSPTATRWPATPRSARRPASCRSSSPRS